MSPHGVWSVLAACVTVAAVGCSPARTRAEQRVLRVCADPNNLPFSDSAGGGFENRLASIVAGEMNARVSYTWWAQRRGFVRNTLNARECDVLMGVPAQFELTAVTHPYYRSSYAFVSRRDRALGIRSLDDSALRHLKIGVQLVGDDYANAPPAHALAKRGIVENVRGFNVQGDYRRPAPPARIIDAVASGDIDLAIAWGPLAGYFASREAVPLDVVPVSPQMDPPALPLAFDIAMGVRRSDSALRDTLNAILTRRRASIDSLLARYAIPVVERDSAPRVASATPRSALKEDR
jgi:mxaJ protein